VNSDDGEFLPLTTAGLQEFLHGSGKDPLSLSPFGDVPLQTAPLSLAFCRPTCNRKASNQQAASLFVNMKNHLLKWASASRRTFFTNSQKGAGKLVQEGKCGSGQKRDT